MLLDGVRGRQVRVTPTNIAREPDDEAWEAVDNPMPRRKLGRMIRWVALTFLLVLSACSEPALHGTTARPLKKVDILWVFDHSPGSCRVEQTLARDFHALTDTLAARGVTDVRFAAIADQQIADKAAYDPVQAAGQLQHSAERHTLPTCQESRQVPCFPQVDAQVLAACDATQEVCLKTCAN